MGTSGSALFGPLGKMARRLAAVVLAFLVPTVLFAGVGLRAFAGAGAAQDKGTTYLLIFLAITVVSIVAAGTLRRPFGVWLGWLAVVATTATGVIHSAMWIVGLIFVALWVTALYQGRKMDELTAAYVAKQ